MQQSVESHIIDALDHGKAFMAYALPCEHDITYIGADSREAADIKISGFGKDARVLSLADACAAGADELYPLDEESTPRSAYDRGLRIIVDDLKCRGGKTVLSRVKSLQLDGAPDWRGIVGRLFGNSDVNSFRFVFYTPQTAGWIGASPELLLACDGGVFTTMALAGTKKADDPDEWDCKNIEEHDMVVGYIMDCFRRVGLSPEISESQTVIHGHVKHLRHMIVANNVTVQSDGDLFDQLLKLLNPTPALAGWPLDQAMRHIAMAERHHRYCYGGYISFRLPDGSRKAYVNLRSSHFKGSKFNVYVGGGLTAKSEPETEWNETEQKSLTIMSVLSN